MLLIIIITIIVTGALIVGALYSSIIPFFSIVSDTANYNIAYYGAIGSTERALVSLRHHKAWYEWRGGFSWTDAISGVITDLITGGFGIATRWTNGMKRAVTSLTNGTIPAWSGGNVEALLEGTWSSDFNMLWYDGLTRIPLYLDSSLLPTERYTDGNVATITATNGIYIETTLRLPPKVLGGFGWGGLYKLDTSNDEDGDNVKDDIMINRWFQGKNIALNQWRSIIPHIKVDYDIEQPIYDFENAIRESHINNVSDSVGTNTPNFFIGDPSGDYEFNVITQPTIAMSLVTWHNAIPAQNTVIDSTTGFSIILNDSNLGEPTLSFNLVNKLSSTIDQVFPFLEYQIKICETWVACNIPVSDRYFRIDASSKIGEYNVHIRLNKPVIENDSSSDFAIVF